MDTDLFYLFKFGVLSWECGQFFAENGLLKTVYKGNGFGNWVKLLGFA